MKYFYTFLLAIGFAKSLYASSGEYEIRIYSRAWCSSCAEIKRDLKTEGITHGFSKDDYSVVIKTIELGDLNLEASALLGATKSYVPEIQIWYKGEMLTSGKFNEPRKLELEKIKNLLSRSLVHSAKQLGVEPPKVGQNVEAYVKDIAPELSKIVVDKIEKLANRTIKDHFISYLETAYNDKYNEKLAGMGESPNLEGKSLSPVAVMFVGTGDGPLNNPIFVGITLKEIKSRLKKIYKLQEEQLVTLYGYGNSKTSQKEADAVSLVGVTKAGNKKQKGEDVFSKVDGIKGDISFDEQGLVSLSNTLKEKSTEKALWIFAGHGNKEGVGLWGESFYMTPELLASYMGTLNSENVIVSGTCYGGQFASVGRCGFFAARPNTTAAGCWKNEKYRDKDYVSTFISALDPTSKTKADSNNDGKVSFSEAHWYATIYGVETDSTYSSMDAIADFYFKLYGDSLPKDIKVKELRKLSQKQGNSEEQAAMTILLSEYKSDEVLYVKDQKREFHNKDKNLLLEANIGMFSPDPPFSMDGEIEIFEDSLDKLNSIIIENSPRSNSLLGFIGGLFDSESFDSESLDYEASMFVREWIPNKGPVLSLTVDYKDGGGFREILTLESRDILKQQRRSLTQLARRLLFKKHLGDSLQATASLEEILIQTSITALYLDAVACESQDVGEFLTRKSGLQ